MRASMVNNPFKGKAILLVEDNRVNSEITLEILHVLGCEAALAENGKEAIEAAKKRPFDLIFMDCHMPVMDGFAATRELRKMMDRGEIVTTPIVALTGTSQQDDLEQSIASGMNDIMLKPARKDTVETLLTKWLCGEADNLTLEELKARSIVAMSLPADMPAEHFGIDTRVFAATAEMLGDKFSHILAYYLEDAQSYVQQIRDGLVSHNTEAVRDGAYALRSASRQLGIIELAYFADRMELNAQALLAGEPAEDLRHFLYSIDKEMERICPFLHEQIAVAKAA